MARRPRNLSAEDRKLWSRVASTARPLKPGRPVSDAEPSPERKRLTPKPAPKLPEFQIGGAHHKGDPLSFDLAPDVAARVAGAPVRMDAKALKKLQRGRLHPEARLDLHGMTLSRAHPALTGFVLSSHSAGRRLVLVITGKGRGGSDAPGPIPERRGALRDLVPHWLSAPPLGAVVMQVVQAHASHGGGGAYYVYLRRNRG